MKHTKSTASYIEAIKRVTDKLWYARAVDISRELNITAGSTSTGLKVLEKKWMITFDKNKFVELTKEAEDDIASFIVNRDLLKDIFLDFMSVEDEIIIDAQIEEIYFLMNDDFIKLI